MLVKSKGLGIKLLYSASLALLIPAFASAAVLQGSTLDLQAGQSKVWDDGMMHLSTSDTFMNMEGAAAYRFSNEVDVGNNGSFAGASKLFEGAGLGGNALHVATGGYMYLDAPAAVIVKNNLDVTGRLNVVGSLILPAASVNVNALSGTLPVANGGTGAATFTANGVLFGNGANGLVSTAAGTTGQCLLATTAAAPSWGSCSGSPATLQTTYNSSTSPHIVLSSGVGGLTVRDASTPLGTSLLAVQNNAGSTTYLGVTAAGTSVTGTLSSSGALTVTSGGASITGALTGLTGLTVASGTVSVPAASIADAALSSNIPLKNASNTFSQSQIINGTLTGLTGLTVASGGATVTAGGLTITAGGATIGGQIRQASGRATYSAGAPNTIATATAAVADLLDNRIILHSAAANDTITTPTAALLVAGITSPAVGDTFSFLLSNSAAANTATLVGGSGVTVSGPAAVAAVTSRVFYCRMTNVTGGSEAVTCY